MEPHAPARLRPYLIAALILAVASAGALVAYRQSAETPLSRMVKTDLPMLDIAVKFLDQDRKEIAGKATRLGDERELPEPEERCPALIGGDHSQATLLSPDEKRPADCPKWASWYVRRHPIALSLYFEDGEELLDWYDHNTQAQEWTRNRFVQGLLYGLLHSLRIRAEELKLEGLKGEFMVQMLRAAIAARGQLHYDEAHGNRGWVLSFDRADSGLARTLLPVVVTALGTNGYRLAKLTNPIVEVRVGLQRLFLGQEADRFYLALSLEALLNVLESLTPPSGGVPDAPLAVTLRAEAFVDKLLPVMAGSPGIDVTLAFTLTGDKLGSLSLRNGPWARRLYDRIFEGVLASIPHDAFAAVATSWRLPSTLTQDDWRKLGTDGPAPQAPSAPEEGGFAVVWDFDSKLSPTGAIGVIVANQTDPQSSAAYYQYLRKADWGAECAGGAVFLAASSERLLARMREACARQSLSPLDWEGGAARQRYTSAQLMGFVNPGTGLRELFLAGGAGKDTDEENEFAPRWKQDYEKAKAAMRSDGDRLFRQLPIWVYAGRAGQGATVTLDGYAVSQGIAP